VTYNIHQHIVISSTGDNSETGWIVVTRVPMSDPLVATYGYVYELNAWLGLALASLENADLAGMLERIQRDLFAIGARLADPAHRISERVTKAAVSADDIARLERWIDALEAPLPPLRRFILAGGWPAGATRRF